MSKRAEAWKRGFKYAAKVDGALLTALASIPCGRLIHDQLARVRRIRCKVAADFCGVVIGPKDEQPTVGGIEIEREDLNRILYTISESRACIITGVICTNSNLFYKKLRRAGDELRRDNDEKKGAKGDTSDAE